MRSFTQVAAEVQAGDRDGATRRMLTETLPAIDKLQVSVTALADLQQKLADAASAGAHANIRRTQWTLAGAGLLLLGLGSLAAWWLSRSITQPIHQAVTVAEAVASGDLTAHARSTARDETGRLLMALGTMTESLRNV
ncbi:MAG: HAMP domain-containing protein, partial [Burkholderiaceae bacterium]|nr:HAMP domain-containing protein [Burkholderiaceae bacterium]